MTHAYTHIGKNSVTEVFDDPSDILWAQELLIRDVLDEHAPIKTKCVRGKEPPFLNKHLKKSIYNKTRLHTKYRIGPKKTGKIIALSRTKLQI